MSACRHPAAKLWTGFVGGVPNEDAMWIACGSCGRVLRVAPIVERLEVERSAPVFDRRNDR